MTLVQMEKRVKALETTVRELAENVPLIRRDWYRTHAGRFANDTVFDEITQLGRAYRKAQATPHRSKRS